MATATPTNTPSPADADEHADPADANQHPTSTRVPPTPTHTPTRTPIPPTPTFTPTNTRVPPTPTNTRIPPTSTNTPVALGAISGSVDYCPNGDCAPAGGASVSAGGRTTTANGNGFYTFTNLPAGTYTVTASYRGSAASTTVTVVSGKTSNGDLEIICCRINGVP